VEVEEAVLVVEEEFEVKAVIFFIQILEEAKEISNYSYTYSF
jgi:hypothetical protein